MSCNRCKREAFTLIELLVVIAIIAVLMSILMPALSAVKKQAKAVHCVNNIRSLSMGWFMYKDDNDDMLVRGETGVGNWIEDKVTSYSLDAMEQEKEGIRRGKLYTYVGKSVESYRCPADMRILSPDLPTFRTYSIAGGMYGVPKGGAWEIVPHTKYSTIKNPAKKYVFLGEADPRGMNMGSWVMYPKTREWVDPFAIWHTKNRSTLGFADGHGEMHRWESQDLADWCTQIWESPGTFQFYRRPETQEEVRDFNYMWDGYAYRRLL